MVGQENGIVVGVDGSEASVAALRWAVARAVAERCPVTAVEVHQPARYLPGTSYAPAPYGMAPPIERQTTRLGEAVAAAVKAVPRAPEVVELQLYGEVASELVRVADSGCLLVLGYTRHGRVTEFLLGDVTGECLRRSRRPVVLVPTIS